MADWEIYRGSDESNPWNPGNGGAGQADRNDGDPILRIQANQMVANAQTPEMLMYHLLHEVAHVTMNGYLRTGFGYDLRSDGGTTQTQAEWLANEVFANDISREFSEILQVVSLGQPGTQYGNLNGYLDLGF